MENESNPAAHVEHTGPEIWSQANGQVRPSCIYTSPTSPLSLALYLAYISPAPRQVDFFVHGIGTGGCIAGVGALLYLP